MKRKLGIIFFASLFVFNTLAQKNTKEKTEASNIIQLGNAVIGMGNAYNQDLENYVRAINNANYELKKVTNNPNMKPSHIGCDFMTVNNTQLQNYNKALAQTQNFEDKELIKESVKQGQSYIKDILRYCPQLSNYFSEKKYVNDSDRSEYNTIKDSLSYYVTQASKSWQQTSKLASIAGNKAELLLLKDIPIASFVIPMKTDLMNLDQILSDYMSENPDTEAIQAELNKLSESIASNKDITKKDVSKLKDSYYREVYQKYYEYMYGCVTNLDRILSGKYDSESYFKSVKSAYSEMVDRYNVFIKQ